MGRYSLQGVCEILHRRAMKSCHVTQVDRGHIMLTVVQDRT